MGEYMSFQGKQVDDAIASACRHFKCTREELEVEIVSGGSSGIFGLVGVKKAKIKARLREITSAKPAAAPRAQEKSKPTPKPTPKPAVKPAPKSAPRPKQAVKNGAPPVSKNGTKRPPKPRQPKQVTASAPTTPPALDQPRAVAVKDTQPPRKAMPSKMEETPRPAPDFSVEEAQEHIIKSMKVLLTNISDDSAITVDMQSVPIEVVIDDDANSGLIIGRDGQTISALQYILNRIVSRKFPGIARIQLDAGDYREKQDEQLRKTALFLSQKAKTSHRTQSTRPLSSYHRRVVHMALQEDQEIQTRSKGDGPMKRVLVMPRRKKNGGATNGNGAPNTHSKDASAAAADHGETNNVS